MSHKHNVTCLTLRNDDFYCVVTGETLKAPGSASSATPARKKRQPRRPRQASWTLRPIANSGGLGSPITIVGTRQDAIQAANGLLSPAIRGVEVEESGKPGKTIISRKLSGASSAERLEILGYSPHSSAAEKRDVLGYVPASQRGVSPEEERELIDNYHLAKTALQGTGNHNSRFHRMNWAASEFSKSHPSISSTHAYKILDRLLA